MRWGTLLTGMAIGAVTYFYVKENASTVEREREIEKPAPVEHSEVEQLIDDVVHNPDIPETPVKQAFESALHPHEH